MTTQQMNAAPRRAQVPQQIVQYAPPPTYPALQMPGAFPVQSDFTPSADSFQPQFHAHNNYVPQLQQPSDALPVAYHNMTIPMMGGHANQGNHRLSHLPPRQPMGSAQNPYDLSRASYARPNPGGTGGPGGLSSIINRTNRFDFANGLDDQGLPLPEHLASFMHNAAFDSRISDQELRDLLDTITPDMEIPLEERSATVPGLAPNLYHHQELALKWMTRLEEGKNKGGILADDMGLGKTISTLSLMLTRQATSRPKTNLIIGPVALARQWEDEIQRKTKTSHRLSVFIYHKKKATTADLLMYDVVITTYNTVAREYQKYIKFMRENADRTIDYNERSVASQFPLFNPNMATFHRIILDEAQCIKNKRTQTAQACHALYATYRWCLTGTPMMNSVEELFSLVQFLRIKPYSDWTQFNQVSRSYATECHLHIRTPS